MMMNEPEKKRADSTLWLDQVNSERLFVEARQNFLTQSSDRVKVLTEALADPVQRGAALRTSPLLRVDEIKTLFPLLLKLASVGHADIGLCRSVIFSLPKRWVVSNAEIHAENLLEHGTDEEFRRLLELFIELDDELTSRVARKALKIADADVNEAGADFLEKLKITKSKRKTTINQSPAAK